MISGYTENQREMTDNLFEVLDLTSHRRRNDSWIHQVFGEVSRQSAARQVAIGGASGWVSGYLFLKVGKLAAFTVGSTVLLLQIAQHQGYIEINWTRVNSRLHRAKRRIEQEAERAIPALRRDMKIFIQENIFLTASFIGGFLIGMSF